MSLTTNQGLTADQVTEILNELCEIEGAAVRISAYRQHGEVIANRNEGASLAYRKCITLITQKLAKNSVPQKTEGGYLKMPTNQGLTAEQVGELLIRFDNTIVKCKEELFKADSDIKKIQNSAYLAAVIVCKQEIQEKLAENSVSQENNCGLNQEQICSVLRIINDVLVDNLAPHGEAIRWESANIIKRACAAKLAERTRGEVNDI